MLYHIQTVHKTIAVYIICCYQVFTPKRNLYIPNNEYTGAMSDNGSASSNSEDDLFSLSDAVDLPSTSYTPSPTYKHSPTPPARLPSTPSTRPSSAADDRRGDLPKDHPLYQLQLTSVKVSCPFTYIISLGFL